MARCGGDPRHRWRPGEPPRWPTLQCAGGRGGGAFPAL